jgi:hypothetical protein
MTPTVATPPTPTAPTTAGPVRTPTTDSLQAVLVADLRAAHADWTEARQLQARKDSRSHRGAVAESLSRLDALLDMYLEIRSR